MIFEKRKEAINEPKGRQAREPTSGTVACPDCLMASQRPQSGGFLPQARFDKEQVSLLETTNQGIAKDSAGGGSGRSRGYGKQQTAFPITL